MKTFLNLTAIFLMFLFGWWMLFIAIADDANTVSKLDYRVQQGIQEIADAK